MRYKVNFPKIFMLFFLIFQLNNSASAQLFSAVDGLENILETEEVLLKHLQNYIKSEKHRLQLLERYSQQFTRHLEGVSEDVETHVSNPLNAYVAIRKLTSDWAEVEDLISDNSGEDFMLNITLIKNTMAFPTREDLKGSALGLTRLQDTYNLNTSSLARGELNGVKYNVELSAADCFELGVQLYQNADNRHSVLWMNEAYEKFRKESNDSDHLSVILEYLSLSHFELGDVGLALNLTHQLLEMNPNHSRALENRAYFVEELERAGNKSEQLEILPKTNENESKSVSEIFKNYGAACRGELSPPIKILSKLKCKYVNNGNPYLFLAPFKVEELHYAPAIYMFHDVISDEEIETVKELARPRFARSLVQSDAEKNEVAEYRISKSAWLSEKDHKTISALTQRLADMTKLSMASSDPLQVANYGIGGHYDPHYDFSNEKSPTRLAWGDRIATVLFYMSDVAQGGATVFPNINTAVWPKKGAAAFWYNLHESGDGDSRTIHAACPVLAGSKWVCNKWIREKYQEFKRPCSLKRPDMRLVALNV